MSVLLIEGRSRSNSALGISIRSDEGLALETSAIVSFTAFHYPHQHTVDTPVCLPPRRRSQPSSFKSWHYTPPLDPPFAIFIDLCSRDYQAVESFNAGELIN